MKYVGSELEVFANAINWKEYFSQKINPYIFGNVLEVGAGIGGTSNFLINPKVKNWTSLEPDSELYSKIPTPQAIKKHPNISFNKVNGTITNLPTDNKYNSIVYIDVIEHIEKDKAELAYAFEKLLASGGNIVVLVPAFNYLFNEFDEAVGHYRRYNLKMLRKIAPENSLIKESYYLDSMGYIAALTNKFFLRKKVPSPSNISLWDSFLIPISRLVDTLVLKKIGKTAIIIYSKRR